MRLFTVFAATLCLTLTTATYATGTSQMPACGDVPQPKKAAPVIRDQMTAIMLSTAIINAGAKTAIPAFEPPASSCLLPTFSVNTTTIQPVFSPFAKGTQTLHYRFLATTGEEEREFLLLYNGTAGLMTGGAIFYLSESRGSETLVHAAFNGEPRLKELKKLIGKILGNKNRPLIGANWPEGADGAGVTLY